LTAKLYDGWDGPTNLLCGFCFPQWCTVRKGAHGHVGGAPQFCHRPLNFWLVSTLKLQCSAHDCVPLPLPYILPLSNLPVIPPSSQKMARLPISIFSLFLTVFITFSSALKFDLVAHPGHSASNERCIRNFVNKDTLVVVTATVSGNRGDGQQVNMHVCCHYS
jgi:hypothetical protein